MSALNENIKNLRKQCGLNQVGFAAAMNVTKQCVSNWENDNVMPSVEMLAKMADYFGVSTDYLLGRSTDCKIDTSGLTEEQISHLRLVAGDLCRANAKLQNPQGR